MSESDESNMPPFIGLARPVSLEIANQAINAAVDDALYMVRADKAQALMEAEKAMAQIREATAEIVKERDLAAAQAVLPCGHHHSLMLKSAETGEPLYCELCDCISRRNDAETMEAEARAEAAALLALLIRYRNEVPLGHQPHMIAHLVDAAIDAAKESGNG